MIPVISGLILLSSCSKHEQMMFAYTMGFIGIFVILCLPAIILSGVARGNGSRSARTTGIVFASVGGFFAMMYTFNMLTEVRRMDEELILFLFLIWASLIGSLLLIVLPNPKMKQKDQIQAQQYYQQQQQQAQVFATEAEILEYADNIKKQKAAEPTVENSTYLNDDLTDEKKEQKGPDMSGLDDLSDL